MAKTLPSAPTQPQVDPSRAETAAVVAKQPWFDYECFKVFCSLDVSHCFLNFAFVLLWFKTCSFYPVTFSSALVTITVFVVLNGFFMLVVEGEIKKDFKTQNAELWIEGHRLLVVWYVISNYVILTQIVFLAIGLTIPEMAGVFYWNIKGSVPLGFPILVLGSILMVTRCFYWLCVEPKDLTRGNGERGCSSA